MAAAGGDEARVRMPMQALQSAMAADMDAKRDDNAARRQEAARLCVPLHTNRRQSPTQTTRSGAADTNSLGPAHTYHTLLRACPHIPHTFTWVCTHNALGTALRGWILLAVGEGGRGCVGAREGGRALHGVLWASDQVVLESRIV